MKLKYAFMSFSCPELGLDDTLKLAKDYGYDGIEPRLDAKHQHGVEIAASPAQRKEIRQKAADSGIALCCLAVSCRYADPSTASQAVDETRERVDLAAEIGVPRLRVFGGKLGEGLTREQGVEQVSRSLLAVADHAQSRGVTLCMETHDDWCDPQDVAAVMKQSNHPAIAVNWDILHPARVFNRTMDEAFEALRPWVRHVHFHDGMKGPKLEMRPIGEGDIDHRRAIELLRSMQFDGYLSGEWIKWEPYEKHLPRDLARMKEYEREVS